MKGTTAGGITIGQAAAFAGVTVKTVRHYHQNGLIDEPERDSSGYRRYGSADLLRLVQVRTLAAAGVPLAEIVPLLDADSEQFAVALVDVEQRLTNRIEELIGRRETLRRLADGNRLLLPDRACALLERLLELGFTPGYVALHREGLVLFRALVPEAFDDFVNQLEHRFGDPEYVELMKRSWDALSWEPDDPRIEELATATADNLLANHELLEMPAGWQARTEASTRFELINSHRHSPTSARLNALVEAKLRAAGLVIPYQTPAD